MLFWLLSDELSGLCQCHIDMWTDVVGVHLLVESCFLQLAVHLGRNAGEDDMDAVLVVH